ncbi:hypothetical protein [Maricaulis sp.]|uniref:hypothetical protein n=1 Tax=Maricaulis sp. TaxID=1486257 RepID=UPI003A924447
MAKWRILLLFGTGALAGYLLVWLGFGALLEHYSLTMAAGLPASLPPIGEFALAYCEVALGIILLVSLFFCRKAVLPKKVHRRQPILDWMSVVIFSLVAAQRSIIGPSEIADSPSSAAASLMLVPSYLVLVSFALRRLWLSRNPHNSTKGSGPETSRQDA